MSKKIPPDAFEFYMSLGPGRSYQAVAVKYAVSKRAVVDLAKRERWQDRATDIEQKARQAAVEKTQETLEAVNARHLKVLRAVEGKAVEALMRMSITSPADVLRAIDLALRQERLILGEPSARTAVTVEDLIKREYQEWLTHEDEAPPKEIDDGDDDDGADAAQ
jgi:hypothetical protein